MTLSELEKPSKQLSSPSPEAYSRVRNETLEGKNMKCS